MDKAIELAKKAGEKALEYIHAIYITFIVLGGFASILGENNTTKEIIFLIFFGLFYLTLLALFIYNTYTYARKARYAEAEYHIHLAIHSVRDAYRYADCSLEQNTKDFDPKRFETYLVSSLTHMESAFSLVSSVKCRTSIKVIGLTSENKLFVKDLARDSASWEKQNRKPANNRTHLIENNTDFNNILNRDSDTFFEGNLPTYKGYNNSSVEGDMLHTASEWPLSYKSTIVWPIRYVLENVERNETIDDQELLGFLSVDSASRNCFERRYDIDLGAIIADSLFPALRIYSKLLSENKG